MPSPDLVTYVRQQSHDGIAASDVRVSLLEAGWSELDIENAFHDVAAGMQPVSAGASLHEDLAQVRGMVAHLATRVRVLEASLPAGQAGLVGAPLPAPDASLRGAELRPERELTAGHESTAVRFLWVFFALAASVAVGWFFAQQSSAPAPWLWAAVGADLCVLIVLAVVLMKRGKAWGAAALTAVAVVEAALATASAAMVWDLIGSSVAIALGVLYLVFAVVMGRWIDRYARN
jgi:hypothetical protein